MTVYINGAHHNFFFFRDNAGYVVYNADVVVANHPERNGILRCSLAAPSGIDDAVSEPLSQFGCIRAVCAVYLDAAVHCDKAKYRVAVDGMTACCQLIVYAFQVAVYHKHIVAALRHLRFLQFVVEGIGASRGGRGVVV